MKVSSSAFYAWQKCPVSDKTIADAELTNRIFDINRMARRAYGSDRVRDELRLGCQVRVGKTRVERLMRQARIVGLHKPAFRPGCTRRDGTKPSDDLVKRQFTAEGPDRSQPRTSLGLHATQPSALPAKGSVLDTNEPDSVAPPSLPSITPQEGVLQRSPEPAQYTSWAFGQRLRAAGILGSMGSIGDAFDNAMAESFFSTIQRELFNTRTIWPSREELASAIFEWIEAWYNPLRRHTSLGTNGSISPIDHENLHLAEQAHKAA